MGVPSRTVVTLSGETTRHLDRELAEQQRENRVPGLIAAIVHEGEVLWWRGIGAADPAEPDRAPDLDTQFAIGSITKTFTAVLLQRLVHEGRLGLDDRVDAHLPVRTHGDLTLRRMLAHASGLQREPAGDVWDGLTMPDDQGLLDGLDEAETVLSPRSRWHYSNLAYSLLGAVVAKVEDKPWETVLGERILAPLGMTRTGSRPTAPRCVGSYVDPFSDHAIAEDGFDLKALAPAGALWSTVGDLTRWARFIAEGDDAVLPADVLEQMTRPQIIADIWRWTLAWGSGWMLVRAGERVLTGHTGGMPGFVTALLVDRESGTAAIALSNSIGTLDPGGLAAGLLTRALELDPPAEAPWRAGEAPPDELAALTGRWWSEGVPYAFSVHDGALEARAEQAPKHLPPSVFERVGDDLYRTASGREEGETLRVSRHASGAVDRLYWATYPLTRQPLAFGQL
ncbi:MAG: serine hydrolase domain-containing protein [Nocardioidaceae bacterium]